MTRRMIRRDPIENEIELAPSPGSYIRDRACFSFVSSLVEVAAQIAELQTTDAGRAAGVYETFLAGCREKTEHLEARRVDAPLDQAQEIDANADQFRKPL